MRKDTRILVSTTQKIIKGLFLAAPCQQGLSAFMGYKNNPINAIAGYLPYQTY